MANQPKKYKKFVATAATATLVASAIVPVASAAHTDIAGHQFESYINDATALGLFNDGGEFKPQGTLSRKHVALILGRYLEKAGFEPAADYETNPAFADLGTTDAEYIRLASVVKEAGVFGGDGGKLNGANPITREQMAKVLDGLAKAVTGTTLVEAAADIEDVKVSDLATAQAGYRDQIQALADLEITTVENYNPKGKVTRGQFAKFIMLTIGKIEELKETPVEVATKALEAAVKALPAEVTEETLDAAKASVKAVEDAIAALEKAAGENASDAVKAAVAAAKAEAEKTTAAINALEGTKAPLEIASAAAATNTTVTVKLAAPFEGEVAAADFTIEGLTVTKAVVGTSKDTVTLTTSAQTADKEYTVAYKADAKNSAKFVGKKAEGQAFEISSATSRLNTEVTVVLTDAPLRNLTAADFQIAGLEVLSVTTNNNVATLKTSPQVGGASYTVTTPVGAGSATFTGLAAVDTAGVISNITLENKRQIKIEFNKAITWATAQDLSNYFIGLTDETNGTLSATSLDKFEANWKAVPGTQVISGSNASVNYVIIESTDGSLVDESTSITSGVSSGGLGLTYNEAVTIETRGLKDANGYTSNSKGAFSVVDAAAPLVQSVTADASINGLFKTLTPGTSATADRSHLDYTIVNGKAYVEVAFNEPVADFDNSDFKIYVDGIAIDGTASATKPYVVKTDSDADFINKDGSVQEHRTLLIDVTALEKGDHQLKIVGPEDLKENVMVPNPYQTTFKVSDEVKTPPATSIKPKVTDIKQVADNAIEIYFDQKDVVASDATNVTVKGGDYIDAATAAQDVVIAQNKIVTKNTATGTVWTVEIPADKANAGSVTGTIKTAGESVDYLDQQAILRTIEVSNYEVSGNSDAYYEGDTFRKEVALELDVKAPELQTVKAGTTADSLAPKLTVTFSDAPFVGTIQQGTGNIKVSRTDKNGNTTDEYVAVGSTAYTADKKGLEISLGANSALVDSKNSNKLFAESVYTVEFVEGTVKDADESVTGKDLAGTASTTVNLKNIKIIHNEINKVVKSTTTPKQGEVVKGEGLVPQTSKGLIQSGKEIADQLAASATPTATTDTGAATKVGSQAYMAANPNFILVTFDGEVLESSALNKGNYKFNGAALPANAKVTYYTEEINSNTSNPTLTGTDAGKENFVIIELPEGSVQKDGQYTVEVFNITNKSGKVMLPVKDAVQLVDNTKPTVSSVKVIGSKQVELTLDELVKGTGAGTPAAIVAANAKNNFTVTVNGQVLAVTDVKFGTTRNKLVLEVSQDFTVAGAKVSVKVAKDVNGKIFIKDEAGNDLTEGTKSN